MVDYEEIHRLEFIVGDFENPFLWQVSEPGRTILDFWENFTVRSSSSSLSSNIQKRAGAAGTPLATGSLQQWPRCFRRILSIGDARDAWIAVIYRKVSAVVEPIIHLSFVDENA